MPKFGEKRFDTTDPQQFRVYDAERATGFARGPSFDSLDDVLEDAERIMQMPIWRALSRHTLQEGREVEFVRGRGKGAKAKVYVDRAPRIIIPPHKFNRWSLIHELAHCARGRLTCTHGPQFTSSYLRLLHDCWSPELARQLHAQFVKHKVRVYTWYEPHRAVPVPDPHTLERRLDEGAEADLAERRAERVAAYATLRSLCERYFQQHPRPDLWPPSVV